MHLGQGRVREAPAEGRVGHLTVAALEGRLGLELDVRRPGHRFDAAGHEDVAVADHDRVGGRIDGLEAGAAQAVDGLPGDLDRQPGQEAGHARDVAVVLARLIGAAEDDVFDSRRVDARLGDRGLDGQRGHVVRSHRPQRTAVAADGRPHGADDPGLAQGTVEWSGHARIVGRGPLRPGRRRRPCYPTRQAKA